MRCLGHTWSVPTITGQHGRRLTIDLPVDTSPIGSEWTYRVTLETPALSATTTVHDCGDGLITFFEALAESWRGWDGPKEFRSLESEFALSATPARSVSTTPTT